MFGTNPIMKADKTAESLLVHSIFYTIQGEGPFVGTPSVFLRLGGCNLSCYFCDTEFSEEVERVSNDEIFRSIKGADVNHVAQLIVITGGEPLRQNITALCTLLLEEGYCIQIETAGTLWPKGLEVLFDCYPKGISLVCSPKTRDINDNVIRYCKDWKYIVETSKTDFDGLPMYSTQIEGALAKLYRPKDRDNKIYVQPCEMYDENGESDVVATKRNMQYAATIAMRYGYQLSIQVHKLLGLE